MAGDHPFIEAKQRQGWSRSRIYDRLNGRDDHRPLTRGQLQAIGFSPDRINRILAEQRALAATKGKATPDENPEPDPKPTYPNDDPNLREQESAFTVMNDLLDKYGLGSLKGFLSGLIKDGHTDPGTLQIELQQREEWKQRFAGNEELRKRGLRVLSPAEYLNQEAAYAEVLKKYGMPKGFYDEPKDFAKFIGGLVSPNEVEQRASAAMDLVKQVDPTQRRLLSSMYGVNEGDIAAYFLDAKRATPVLQKQLGAVQTGAAAKRAGIETNYSDPNQFVKLNEAGVSPEMAAQGYGQIANEQDPLKSLAGIWGQGQDWTLNDATQSTFFNNDVANRKKKRLIDAERAAFSGASGFDARVSGSRNTAGSF